MLTRGHGEPSDLVVSGARMPSSVHGQAVLPGGGGGSWASVGHRTLGGPHEAVRLSLRHELAVPTQIVVCLTEKVKPAACGFDGSRPHSLSQVPARRPLRTTPYKMRA